MPSLGILMLLAFPAGLALARWQYGTEPWLVRRHAALTTLMFLAGVFVLGVLLVAAGRSGAEEYDVGAAIMFLAIAWAGISTYAIGLISLRASWVPASKS